MDGMRRAHGSGHLYIKRGACRARAPNPPPWPQPRAPPDTPAVREALGRRHVKRLRPRGPGQLADPTAGGQMDDSARTHPKAKRGPDAPEPDSSPRGVRVGTDPGER